MMRRDETMRGEQVRDDEEAEEEERQDERRYATRGKMRSRRRRASLSSSLFCLFL